MKHILKLLFLTVFAGSVFAQFPVPGTLDRRFGRRGVVSEIPPVYVSYVIRSMLTQADGKIIAIGDKVTAVIPQTRYDWMLIRYNQNGSRDWTFGSEGMVTSSFGTERRVGDATIQPDGRIIVCGGATINQEADLAMARYLTNGTLDRSFGRGGLVTTGTSTPDVTSAQGARKVFVLPDGRITLIGTRESIRNDPYQQMPGSMLVARYFADGSLDTSYGIGGKSIVPLDLAGSAFLSAVISSNGSLAMTCAEQNFDKYQKWTFKLDENGSIEPLFGRIPNPSGSDYQILQRLPNDDLVMIDNMQREVFVLRANGQRGPVILSGESLMINGYRFWPGKALMRLDGKFVSFGWAEFAPGQVSRALARFFADGSVDPSYGINGIGYGLSYEADDVLALQPGGGVLNATNLYSTVQGFNLVRYSGDPHIGLAD